MPKQRVSQNPDRIRTLPAAKPSAEERLNKAEALAAQQDELLLQLMYDMTILELGGDV